MATIPEVTDLLTRKAHTPETQRLNAAVVKAAEALDRMTGDPTWDERVNVDQLNMRSAILCVLGQAFGNFFITVGKLHDDGWLDQREIYYAFGGDAPADDWRTVIVARRDQRRQPLPRTSTRIGAYAAAITALSLARLALSIVGVR